MDGSKRYLGVKVVEAKPMTRGEYNTFRGWEIPADEDPADEGFLVEYPDGYISWCPKQQFEEANRSIYAMTFGHAIEAMKMGMKVARAGWNGKGMFVLRQKGYPDGIPVNAQTAAAFGLKEGVDLFKVQPYYQMRCVDGSHQMWLASQSDIDAEDWMVITDS
jgi:hypothetical protein